MGTESGLFFSSVLNCQVTTKQFSKSLRPRFLSTMPLASLTSCILVRLWTNLKSRQDFLKSRTSAASRVESQRLIRFGCRIRGWYVAAQGKLDRTPLPKYKVFSPELCTWG